MAIAVAELLLRARCGLGGHAHGDAIRKDSAVAGVPGLWPQHTRVDDSRAVLTDISHFHCTCQCDASRVLRATSADFYFALPVVIVWSAFGGPTKRIRLDFTEDPSHRTAPRIRASLDMSRPCARPICWVKKLVAGSVQKIRQGVQRGVIDPQRRAVQLPAPRAA